MRHVAKKGRPYVASAIAAPSGALAAGPLSAEEGILYAEVDPVAVTGSRWNLDVAGHYARPDVFDFAVRRRPLAPMNIAREPKEMTKTEVDDGVTESA